MRALADGRSEAHSSRSTVGLPHTTSTYAQALAKVERGHSQDERDVREMIARELVDRQRAIAYFERIEPDLYRFPAIDAASFRQAVVRSFRTL